MKRWGVAIALLIVLPWGCKSAKKNQNPEQQFFDQVSKLSKEQTLAKGDELYSKKLWEEARKYYSFLADSFPNDPLGRRASVKVADTFFKSGNAEGFTEAQVRYKDFSNRFPSDPNRAYALLMLGKCGYQQHHGSMRDLATLREAAENFQQVLKLFPTSEAAKEAAKLLALANEDLATHELLIARFYSRVGKLDGAQLRLDYLFSNYPTSNAAGEGKLLAADLAQLQAALKKKEPTAQPTPTPSSTPSPQRTR